MKYMFIIKDGTNYDYFNEYNYFEFVAKDDKSAIEYAEDLQLEIEKKMQANSVELCPDDVCLPACVYRAELDEEEFEDYVKVEI